MICSSIFASVIVALSNGFDPFPFVVTSRDNLGLLTRPVSGNIYILCVSYNLQETGDVIYILYTYANTYKKQHGFLPSSKDIRRIYSALSHIQLIAIYEFTIGGRVVRGPTTNKL